MTHLGHDKWPMKEVNVEIFANFHFMEYYLTNIEI